MTVLPPRPVRYALAWAGAAGVAVGVGLLAVSLLGGGARPSLASGATAATSAVGSSSPVAAGSTARQPTDGGEVYGTCAGPAAVPAVSGVPAAGWEIEAVADTVQFEQGDREIRVVVGCDPAGAVTFAVENDDRRGGSSSEDSTPSGGTTSSAAVASSSAADDHGGGSGSGGSGSGGSGSGSGSGGSGSDDSGSGGHGGDDD